MTLPAMPTSWSWRTLGEFLTAIESGKNFRCDERPPQPGEVGVVKVSAVTRDFFDASESKTCTDPGRIDEKAFIREGDLLFGRANGSLRLVGRAVLVGSVTGRLMLSDKVLRLKTSGVDPRWVLYALRSPFGRGEIERLATGIDMHNIGQDRIRQVRIPVAPPDEQDRIVAEIEKQFTRIDAGVAALQRLQAHLRRYRAAVLKAACEGTLVQGDAQPAPRGAFVSAAEYLAQHGVLAAPASIADGARRLPSGWAWTTIGLMKKHSMYGPRFSSDDYRPDGRLVLRTSDINESGKVNTATAPRLPLSDGEFSRYKVERGDLLITRTGSLGTLAVFDDDVDAIPGAYLIHYRLRVPAITTRYVFTFLKSPDGQRQLVGGGAGVGRPNLNAPTIEKILIPLPPPAEQERILDAVEEGLSRADNIERGIAASIARAGRLRSSVLRSACEGRLVAPELPARAPAA